MLVFICVNHPVFSQNARKLYINGSDSISDIIIRQIDHKKEIVSDSLYLIELDQFRDKLERMGFVQHNIDSVFKNDSIYFASFTLNRSVKLIRLSHPDMNEFAKIADLKTLTDSTIEIPFIEVVNFLNSLTSYYQNNGHPFAKLSLSNIRKKNDVISADLLFEKKEQRSIDKIIIKGYTNFPTSFLNHLFRIRQKGLFNKIKISQTSELVKTVSFVSEIKKPEILFTKDSTALYLYLTKIKSNYFDGLIGFSSGQEGKGLKLNGNVDLKLINSFDRGESLQLNWISTQNNSQSLKLSLETPFLFNTPLSSGYEFDIYKQDSTYLNISNFFKTDYKILSNHRIGISIETTKSNKINTPSTSNILEFSNTFYGVSYSYDKPNYNRIFTKKFHFFSHVAQGNRNKTTQTKITNDILYLIDISKRHNILLKNTSEILISDNFLENELYKIGGSNSIRGFDERSLVANSYSYANIEYNYLLNDDSFISAITDLGLLENKLTSSLYMTYSFGIGFSQKTKVGQLGIQYLLGNTHDHPFTFNSSKLHLKISQVF